MTPRHNEIVVIGGGAVGIACALWLRRDGHQVTLIEPNALAAECSFGNASTLAEYGCTPIANASVWGRLPSLLFSQDSPFVVRWSRIPQLMPWLLRFLGQCNTHAAKTNTHRLLRLLERTYSGYEPLLEASPEAAALIRRRGCLYAYTTEQGMQAGRAEIALRESLGIEQEVLNANQVADLEPVMAGQNVGGVLFPRSCHIRNTQQFFQNLAAPLQGSIKRARVQRVVPQDHGVAVSCDDGSTLLADRVVLAAGAWSAQLAASFGERIPLGVERGFHVEFDLEEELLTRPTCPVESAFYMTPLEGGRLRAAGTVELASMRDPINLRRTNYIEERVRQILHLEQPASRRWMGFRPTLPDCVPVLGPSRQDPRVLYAFGHQHLGITLAGATGQLIADCIHGRAPQWLDEYSASRFT
ncbi:FAD-binding oxidoreductase [Pseudomonas sp. NCCP-436]|uniref:NAD(P)/FAD-dependent oxidoreductase n=1 Tax=Pseudomonas sp. NCCP-436 TaxID=2842481 RepID=UPI001C81904F|nr:FAD-dependent oxidoreductase [Pseudomonas sp. NCCP-436]GIZ12908.1 cytochrome c4 [Pseudomonas sp. NCCP-436]